ncbi:MAG: DUF4340 domain-containing protein, partial [Cyclobacteriaceae bacterium]|nr:DUF4340 domain-containing protein [Cyclobacteriaceae bacterium]
MKNANNLKLIALLGGLVLIFVAIRVFRSPSLESNLPKTLATIDSTKVTAIIIKSPRAQSEIKLARSGKRWELKSGDRTGRLEQGGAITALRSLMDLQPQRIVSKRKEKWNDFQVGDSTGTRVTVMEGDDVEADLWIGKTGFTPAPGNNGQFGGSGFTHVRLNGENEVYTVDGFLEGQFNRGFNDWRDKRFTRLLRDSVDKIVFRYPA